MGDPARLRELARWYREFAERTANPTIWDWRLRTADRLEADAERIEREQVALADATPPPTSGARGWPS